MSTSDSLDLGSLKILHCFRSPVGGIFRHVRDLIDEQTAQGHKIGILCDNNTGGPFEEKMLADLAPKLKLGLFRLPMNRSIGLSDGIVSWKLYNQIKGLNVDILHSHGAKGGAYARLIGSMLRLRSDRPVRLYCPHGGSIHYDQSKLSGRIYFSLERLLERMTDRLLFVSEYERDAYFSKVGNAHCPHSLVRNGLTKQEFVPVKAATDATDFSYIGMMRDLKGVDLFLEALPLVAQGLDRPVTATLVGDGPDIERYKCRAAALGPTVTTRFFEPMQVREAFALGKTLVVPSRAESMPYIVLEALAARVPLITTAVGGIPEIFGEYSKLLVEPGSPDALARSMADTLSGAGHLANPKVMALRIKDNFSASVMSNDVMAAYKAALES